MTRLAQSRLLAALACLVCLLPLEPWAASRVAAEPSSMRSGVCERRRPARGRRRPARGRRNARRPTRPPRPAVTRAYIRMRTAWHRAAPPAVRARWASQPIPPLIIKPVGGAGTFELVPERDGTFGPEALARAREAFRYRNDHETADVHPRLLEIAYRAARNFGAPYVHLVSGFRTTRSTSRHNQGRAMDIVLPGVPDERLASYLRQQAFVGVGVYPTSGFVHLDVRARSYFWTDRSGPTQPSRAQGTLAHLVSRYDAAGRRRGEVPVPDLVSAATEDEEGAEAPSGE